MPSVRRGRLWLVHAVTVVVAVVVGAFSVACVAQSGNGTYPSLLVDQPLPGSLPAASTAYYLFASPAVSYQQTALISVSASIGSPTMYVSLSDAVPSPTSFDYQASWLTGGVVSVLVQPPYTAYVAVASSSYSSCNYSVVVTVYETGAAQPAPIPLSNTVPLASATAAGEYRYYTYDVTAGTASVTVALTEAYGQSYLLINSPNATQLPTLSSYQYSSSSPTYPLVPLVQPVAGVWTVGVWSNASSAFSITAADSTDTEAVQLGVTYPGYVQAQNYTYYSIYLDPLLLANGNIGGYLDIELLSLSGDADLCCSNVTTRPTRYDAVWVSENAHWEDRVVLPTSQLQAGPLYCGILGFKASGYLLSVSFDSPITLPQGDTIMAQSTPGDAQLYSMVFPASKSLITLSVVNELGTSQVFVSPYGRAPAYSNTLIWVLPAATFVQQFFSTPVCGVNNSFAIPGSSPPLCQMQVAVSAASLSIYSISATLSGEVMQLVGGLPMESAVSTNQSAYFAFNMPDNLSNATIIITVTNGASGLTLAVGEESYSVSSFYAMWTVNQRPDSDVIVFQLDWTDPQFFPYPQVRGDYVAVLTTASDTATFSVVYTVTNGSIFSDSIVQLLDGEPQDSIVSASVYDFYYFTPPIDGWPYAVTISVAWGSGFGIVRVVASNMSQVGPIASDNAIASGSDLLTINPNSYGACNPVTNPTCGYSISVQCSPLLRQQTAYTIVAASSNWVRLLYVGGLAQLSAVLSVGDADYWETNWFISSSAVAPQLVYLVSVLSGSVTVFASNMSAPNAGTAQLTWPQVSSTAVLSAPVPAGQQITSYLTVMCTSTDGTACQYSVEAATYLNRTTTTSAGSIQTAPVRLLLPANGIGWAAFSLAQISTASYMIIQASVTVGSPTMYASCISYQSDNWRVLPNETFSTWQASGGSVAAPPTIELFNFNASSLPNCTTLVVGVRASGGQGALVGVSVTAAGVEQIIRVGGTIGLSTPAYPVSYYQYTLSDASLPVLSFMLTNASSACSTSQLQMAVSDTVPYPNLADPNTYNFSRTAVTLPNGATDLTIAISNYSKPGGSLHAGTYYVAVQSAVAGLTCQYQLRVTRSSQTLLQLGWVRVVSMQSFGYSTYMSFAAVAYNTSTSLAVQLYHNTGAVSLFVGVNSMPSPADPSTYLLSTMYNTTLAGSNSTDDYEAQPIYIPASACSSSTLAGQPCTLVMVASASNNVGSSYTYLWMKPMSSVNATWLLENQTATVTTAASSSTTYQFSLPASPLQVVVSVNTSNPVALLCSYQYVTPDLTFYDWQTNSSGSASTEPSTTTLNFTWGSTTAITPLQQTNAGTLLAALPTTCYCTVQASSSSSYSIVYLTTAMPSTLSSTTSDGLSRGALVAAVVVPIVAVLLLAGLMLWLRRGGSWLSCCGDVAGKHWLSSRRQQQQSESDTREVSMADLTRNSRPPIDGRLISQQWHSDSA